VIADGTDASWARFEADIATATHEIVAVLPAGHDTNDIAAALESAKQRDVRLAIHNARTAVGDASMDGDDEPVAARVPRPLIVIDRRVIWDGCPAPGRPTAADNGPRRIASPRVASALVQAVATSPHTPDADGTEYQEVIATREVCPKCGGLLRATVGAESVILACQRAPQCAYKRRLRKHDHIPTDRTCPACGQPMIMRAGSYGAFLGCGIFPACRQTVNLGQRRA